jgi:G3E family GTPase
MEIPVYLFTGFLDAGKTSFIQKTLEDPRFNQGENTLLLLCEEGEEEYKPSAFSGHHVFIETIESMNELTPDNLDRKCKKHACERVVVEYNGMWLLDAFYGAMPKEWTVYQEFMFVDAPTFLQYNTNLRELVVDKLSSCEMVVFNRANSDLDQMEIHKIVRAISRRSEIVYEDKNGNVTYDQIPDELPFDLNAPVINIGLEDYATWYRDISEEMEKYEGKAIKLSGHVIFRKDLPDNTFVFGRQVMTCCSDDLTFAGVLCVWKDKIKLNHQDWVEITGKIELRQHKIYGRKGPVLQVLDLQHGEAPDQTVATFY